MNIWQGRFAGADRFLSGHRRLTSREWLAHLADAPGADDAPDLYNEGPALQQLETDVARLLGKPKGRFVVKGVMAQQALLRVWAERSRRRTVALHALSHIERDEDDGYRRLHGLEGITLGGTGPFTLDDLRKVNQPLGVVTVELPISMGGHQLPSWDELTAISHWCRENRVPLHFDGARLWESAPYYGKSLAEVAALADSVYVSFYKTIGGLAGCVIAGDEDVIDETVPWTTRHGGNVFTVFPYVLAAREGLRARLPKIDGYRTRARSLAAAIAQVPGVSVNPDPPHTNAFRVFLPGTPEQLTEAHRALVDAEAVWLFNAFEATGLPGLSQTGVTVGDATEELTDDEVARLIGLLVAKL
ncbi:L-threonine aldolase [Amycolatopsis xylanica]|uniref:L-threonine aldolase n=1 Tax=Amycolatopsis xylanica TaxID=589385 RepID=A0A1H2Y3J1_9PSEU|nr:beta-eliminating lyase-related protein [Amycolatopsis xylanica]SDW99783.1 L-threonine aldolase [Amycolatopsis xylanica]